MEILGLAFLLLLPFLLLSPWILVGLRGVLTLGGPLVVVGVEPLLHPGHLRRLSGGLLHLLLQLLLLGGLVGLASLVLLIVLVVGSEPKDRCPFLTILLRVHRPRYCTRPSLLFPNQPVLLLILLLWLSELEVLGLWWDLALYHLM